MIPEYREREYKPVLLSREKRCLQHVCNLLLYRNSNLDRHGHQSAAPPLAGIILQCSSVGGKAKDGS